MNQLFHKFRSLRGPWLRSSLLAISLTVLFATPAFALQGSSPWENAVNVLQQAFTSTIARGLSLVAIVVAGPHLRLR